MSRRLVRLMIDPHRRDDVSVTVRGGLFGVAMVALLTVAVTVAGVVIAFVVVTATS